MQTVRHERDRSKEESADDFGAHHPAAEPNHSPGFALTLLVPLAQEAMRVVSWLDGLGGRAHGCSHFK
jgi:hypothetical protein